MTYNGWTNYETWRIHLEMFDGISSDDLGFLSFDESMRAELVAQLREFLRGEAVDIIESQTSEGIARSLALSVLSDVNWDEIADHILENQY